MITFSLSADALSGALSEAKSSLNEGALTSMTKQGFDPEFMTRTKRAMIASANTALDYKTKNPKLSDNEVLTYVIAHLEEILRELQG